MEELISKLPGIIGGVAEGSTVGTILKLVLLLGLGIGAWLLSRWIKKQKQAAAQRETDQGRAKDQGSIVDDTQKDEDAMKKSEQEVRDIFNKPKP